MTRRHRGHSVALKRMIVEACLDGEPLMALSKKFDIRRHLIRSWVEKYELGEFDDEHVRTDLVPEYETRIAALERLVGEQLLAPRLGQRAGSRRQILIGRRDARVTDQHPSRDSISISPFRDAYFGNRFWEAKARFHGGSGSHHSAQITARTASKLSRRPHRAESK